MLIAAKRENKMKKLIGIKILTIALILTSLTTNSLASTAETRIRFVKGRSSATVKGTLAPGASRTYALNLRSEQTFIVNITSGNRNVELEVSDVHGKFETDASYANVYTDANGDHWIEVRNKGKRATSYTMTVSAR
jgi:hypothetical protein